MKTLFLTYANSQVDPLPSLTREDDTIYSILVNRFLKGHYLIHRDSFTTLEKINSNLSRFSKNIAVFLYSGHAGAAGLHFDEADANAKGIAYQLRASAETGALKLVVLNGCSTGGQVQFFLNQGVPAVVATSAPVDDSSATEFSIRFFQCLVEKRMTIVEAFEEALGPAQTATTQELNLGEIPRGIRLRKEINGRSNKPLWGLYCTDETVLTTNPIPSGNNVVKKSDFVPNDALTEQLFETLAEAGNARINALKVAEEEGDYIETGTKQTNIVNVLPFPIAVHLQKLLCPVEQENEGFDKISLRRLEQIARVYHTSIEFMAFVMLAQLWELRQLEAFEQLPPKVLEAVRRYFYLPSQDRLQFDYLPFIRLIRQFFDTLHRTEGVPYFIEEIKDLKELALPGKPFTVACEYLHHLQQQAVQNKIPQTDIGDLCEEAEERLCEFFSHLGFIHRYTLTSIQNIDIQKYRHQQIASFNHELVKLMRAFGKPEHNYYLLPDFLDNRGVILVKGKVKVVNPRKKQFEGEQLEYLNLSPFLIDRNAFEENTDLSNLLSFDFLEPGSDTFHYKNVKRPDSRRDSLIIAPDGSFEVVAQQLNAFRSIILNEETASL